MNARYVDPQIIFSMSLKKKFDVQPVTQRRCMKGWVAFTGLSSGTFVFCITNFVVSAALTHQLELSVSTVIPPVSFVLVFCIVYLTCR